eukprot:CAMPEP_0173184468 /NCGR_PEP_ID=MMETSP1141-20130122/8989_1 /TAXON_ID=483371 /ORGANISM="non described non described, Strain CCMP2298" /LENGTH=81 /DNA_ID=CAMNT_0014107835 /DNA_START=201 /DNA_END=446 /DNA_ORIENTATION=+
MTGGAAGAGAASSATGLSSAPSPPRSDPDPDPDPDPPSPAPPSPASDAAPVTGGPGGGLTALLHSGHRAVLSSHCVMHSRW